ncbi:UPF0280 family protein [Breznakiella homolactica]|uniref:Uncharacterized protein n=1 Tax=Breznakiella homolactica TaxID=2798577 RepID=A0A7T8B7G4_9SPIR|nr:hypothetical protein [Breznakiella homolactica]QQO07489.1 hypothetical protein JFL75_11015 [Breznakiella homolactica]
MYRDRFYRERLGGGRFYSFTLREEESDLWIGWNTAGGGPDIREVASAAEALLRAVRRDIQAYAAEHRDFTGALEPLPADPSAPPAVLSMLNAGAAAAVGPMAAVAGAIAEAIGRGLADRFGFRETIVENGGDLWVSLAEPLSLSVYAGLSSLSGKFSITIDPSMGPCGIACSSGTVGPSLSYGKADAAVVIARDAAAADAWATALGNRLKYREDLAPAVNGLMEASGELRPLGALAVMGDRMAAAGNIKLGPASAEI